MTVPDLPAKWRLSADTLAWNCECRLMRGRKRATQLRFSRLVAIRLPTRKSFAFSWRRPLHGFALARSKALAPRGTILSATVSRKRVRDFKPDSSPCRG
jgi:hypothetical protein